MTGTGVGRQATKEMIDDILSDAVIGLRNLDTVLSNLTSQLEVGGDLHGALVQVGYDDTAQTASPLNPAGLSPAALAAYYIGLLTTLDGVYQGTVQCGGAGGTGASITNFRQALAPLQGGNVK